MIRHADPKLDAGACSAIYAPFVNGSPVSFEERAPDPAQMRARIERSQETHPWLVDEHDGQIAGFAYAGPHRDRAGYRWAADVSVYVDAARRRQGVGRGLYEALFALLRRQRLQVAVAGITLPNVPSVGMHEALGFTPIGIYRRIGYKAGAWRDVGWWQLELIEAGDGTSPPDEPLGPQPLD